MNYEIPQESREPSTEGLQREMREHWKTEKHLHKLKSALQQVVIAALWEEIELSSQKKRLVGRKVFKERSTFTRYKQ